MKRFSTSLIIMGRLMSHHYTPSTKDEIKKTILLLPNIGNIVIMENLPDYLGSSTYGWSGK